MASATTRGGSSGRGGGPYADAAVEFLALWLAVHDVGGVQERGALEPDFDERGLHAGQDA